MKKAFTLFFVIAILLSLAACSEYTSTTEDSTPSSSESVTPQQTEEITSTEPDDDSTPTAQLGETVSTDIVDFTLEYAALSFYANPSVDDDYMMPVALPPNGNTIFSAPVGHCLLITTITVKNNNRTTMNIGDWFGDWNFIWSVLYNGKEYSRRAFDLNETAGSTILDINPHAVLEKETGHLIDENWSTNYILEPGDEATLRFISVIGMNPDSLNDSFELKINAPSSSGKDEYFTYQIPEQVDDADSIIE